jgi:hypothetical protein
MKTRIILVLLLAVLPVFGQYNPDSLKTTVFGLTPLSKRIGTINGLALGIGHFTNTYKHPHRINGLNLELNPFSPFILLIAEPARMETTETVLTHNGLQLSTGGFLGGTAFNGLALSVLNVCAKGNGLMITGFYNVGGSLNGMHISGIANSAEKANGLFIACVNHSDTFSGLQVGLYNNADMMRGVQIGLFNKSSNMKGLQLGLWNKNSKRSLPLINF